MKKKDTSYSKIKSSIPQGEKKIISEKQFPIVVIGASAGGFTALRDLVNHLPFDSRASVFIVQHLSAQSNIAYFVQHLQRHTSFRCKIATNNQLITTGTISLAVPGVHLIITDKKVIYGTGPDENRFKPSIDVLFRSAAVHYRERVIGIILSGLLDDGVAGMAAIKSCGGVCIVQDPAEAEYGQMPLAVIEKVKPHYTIPASAMGDVIFNIAKKPQKKISDIPTELVEESRIAEKVLSDINETRRLGIESLYTCPDCGGVLFQINDHQLNRYRCFTGHAYSESTLLEKQNESIEATLWVALRLFEEKKKLLSGISRTDNTFIIERLKDFETHITKLKSLLSDIHKVTTKEMRNEVSTKISMAEN